MQMSRDHKCTQSLFFVCTFALHSFASHHFRKSTPTDMAAKLIQIKAKFGDDLRRFSIVDNLFTLATLEEKLRNLFFAGQSTRLSIKYEDDDGDIITLSTNEDLAEGIRSALAHAEIARQVFRVVVAPAVAVAEPERPASPVSTVTSDPEIVVVEPPRLPEFVEQLLVNAEFLDALNDIRVTGPLFHSAPLVLVQLLEAAKPFLEVVRSQAFLELRLPQLADNVLRRCPQVAAVLTQPTVQRVIGEALPELMSAVSEWLQTNAEVWTYARQCLEALPRGQDFTLLTLAPLLQYVLPEGRDAVVVIDRNGPRSILFGNNLFAGQQQEDVDFSRFAGLYGGEPEVRGPPIHHGVTCDDCGTSPITGARYKCTVCHDFDLCQDCEAKGEHNPRHALIKMAIPRVPRCGRFSGMRGRCTRNQQCMPSAPAAQPTELSQAPKPVQAEAPLPLTPVSQEQLPQLSPKPELPQKPVQRVVPLTALQPSVAVPVVPVPNVVPLVPLKTATPRYASPAVLVPVDSELEDKLAVLNAMGFPDRDHCTSVLRRVQMNVQAAVDELLKY
eukprot:TRINITY_DN170_c0_g1_i2.p1 TRINITY_DN170_c0_g1~~TRINITY_DN170_c0_g1_i2.p1  ORF type:complete len:557 (-),score=118.14 TRINITY_DN170_c0_g1_i2:70-1740(-)